MAKREESKKVVLAYSGGLDTSVVVRWLTERAWEVYLPHRRCWLLGVRPGPGGARAGRRVQNGFDRWRTCARRPSPARLCFPALMAGAMYEGRYPLATALARPLIAKAAGWTWRGREGGAPRSRTAAPAKATTRSDSMSPCRRAGAGPADPGALARMGVDDPRLRNRLRATRTEIPITVSDRQAILNRREPLGPGDRSGNSGRSVELSRGDGYLVLDRESGRRGGRAAPQYMEDHASSSGVPVAIDGERSGSRFTLITAGPRDRRSTHGVGRIDMIENRLVGIKSREVYEAHRRRWR